MVAGWSSAFSWALLPYILILCLSWFPVTDSHYIFLCLTPGGCLNSFRTSFLLINHVWYSLCLLAMPLSPILLTTCVPWLGSQPQLSCLHSIDHPCITSAWTSILLPSSTSLLILSCIISDYCGYQFLAECWPAPLQCLSVIPLRLLSPD